MSSLPIPRPALQVVSPPDVYLTLTIHGWDYDVRPVPGADPSVAVRAWALRKLPLGAADPAPVYHVRQAPEGWIECDCADALYRRCECKHAAALCSLQLLTPPAPPAADVTPF